MIGEKSNVILNKIFMIEIKELSIKVNIEPSNNNNTSTNENSSIRPSKKEELLEECLEQVVIMLKNKKER